MCHVDFKLCQHNINQYGIASKQILFFSYHTVVPCFDKQIGVYTVVKLQIQNTVEWKPISCFLVEGFLPFNGQFLSSKINSLYVKFSLKISHHNVQKLLIPKVTHSKVFSASNFGNSGKLLVVIYFFMFGLN